MMMIRKMMMVTTTVTKECKRGLCHHSVTLLLSWAWLVWSPPPVVCPYWWSWWGGGGGGGTYGHHQCVHTCTSWWWWWWGEAHRVTTGVPILVYTVVATKMMKRIWSPLQWLCPYLFMAVVIMVISWHGQWYHCTLAHGPSSLYFHILENHSKHCRLLVGEAEKCNWKFWTLTLSANFKVSMFAVRSKRRCEGNTGVPLQNKQKSPEYTEVCWTYYLYQFFVTQFCCCFLKSKFPQNKQESPEHTEVLDFSDEQATNQAKS